MELELNRTNSVTAIHPCYKLENSSYIITGSPSVICILYIFLALLCFITVCGNLLVVISIVYFKQLHTPTNYLIMSLAVADLLVGLFVFPLSMAFSQHSCVCHIHIFCEMRSFFDVSLCICSTLNLYCICIDRYYAVCQPLTYKSKMNHNVVMTMILLSWGVSVLAGIFVIIIRLFSVKCVGKCLIAALIGTSIGQILSFYLPMIIMFCVYFKIVLVALKQAHSIQNTKSGGSISKTERKATKTLATVLGVFLICLTPFSIWISVEPFTHPAPHAVTEALKWLTLSNSMLNPFIYAFFYSWFRTTFRMIISGKVFIGDLANTKLT